MQLGWIDFSKNERDKVLGVLDSLTEQGTLDELGIAPIRDGFSDLFFPGTSTLHKHAKYYFLVPYACIDLEHSVNLHYNTAYSKLYEIERSTAEILHKNHPHELGVIGGGYVNRREWIKRPPSVLYWAGLRRLGIINGNISLNEYLKALCALKSDKDTLKKLGNRNDAEDCDDKDAGFIQSVRFFSVPTYRQGWKGNLTLRLTRQEAEYLRERIKRTASDSLLFYLLDSGNEDILKCDSFETLTALVNDKRIRDYCDMAVAFGKFLYVLRVVYNMVVSQGKNEKANEIIAEFRPNLTRYAGINIESIISCLRIVDSKLRTFLYDSKQAMAEGDIEKLKLIVTNREKSIKGSSRAKTVNAGSFDKNKWIGGTYLDYRFAQAKQLLKEIRDGEKSDV